jgi:hypothetical protein
MASRSRIPALVGTIIKSDIEISLAKWLDK